MRILIRKVGRALGELGVTVISVGDPSPPLSNGMVSITPANKTWSIAGVITDADFDLEDKLRQIVKAFESERVPKSPLEILKTHEPLKAGGMPVLRGGYSYFPGPMKLEAVGIDTDGAVKPVADIKSDGDEGTALQAAIAWVEEHGDKQSLGIHADDKPLTPSPAFRVDKVDRNYEFLSVKPINSRDFIALREREVRAAMTKEERRLREVIEKQQQQRTEILKKIGELYSCDDMFSALDAIVERRKADRKVILEKIEGLRLKWPHAKPTEDQPVPEPGIVEGNVATAVDDTIAIAEAQDKIDVLNQEFMDLAYKVRQKERTIEMANAEIAEKEKRNAALRERLK